MLDKLLSRTVANGECLEWTGCLNTDGYPRANIKGNANVKVHRLVFQLTHDINIDGLVVRHKCDNPKCINPNHLLSGTFADNNRDRDERGRNGKAMLSHSEVREIRDLLSCKQFQNKWIAKEYGIDSRTVSSIKHDKHWKHVT